MVVGSIPARSTIFQAMLCCVEEGFPVNTVSGSITKDCVRHVTERLCQVDKLSKPFPIVEVPNFLPTNFFLSLRSSFPEMPLQPDSQETIYRNRGTIRKRRFYPTENGIVDFGQWRKDHQIFQDSQW